MGRLVDPNTGCLLADLQHERETRPRHGFTDAELQQPVKTVRPGKRRPLPRPETYTRPRRKIGRNESCPCNSGRKYKRCHMPGAVR